MMLILPKKIGLSWQGKIINGVSNYTKKIPYYIFQHIFPLFYFEKNHTKEIIKLCKLVWNT